MADEIPAEVYEAARIAAAEAYHQRTGLRPVEVEHYVHVYSAAAADAVWPLAYAAGRASIHIGATGRNPAVSKFKIGDKVQMPDVPIAVTVTGLGQCEDGPECPMGEATFSFQDPGGMGEDWMHQSEFRKVAG